MLLVLLRQLLKRSANCSVRIKMFSDAAVASIKRSPNCLRSTSNCTRRWTYVSTQFRRMVCREPYK
jgi:hypothetical protein